MKELVLIGIIIGIFVLVTLPLAESAIPPTRAFQRITTSNDTIHAFNSSANLNINCISGCTVTGSNFSKTMYLTVTAGGGNMTFLDDAGDVVITSPLDNDFLRYDGLRWINEALTIGTGNATVINDLGDVIISGLATDHILQSNSNGQFVNKLFKIDNGTCTGSQVMNGINNATGDRNCVTVTGGSGNATLLDELGDVVLTSPTYHSILSFNGFQWIDKVFSINNQTTAKDFQVIGINNQTGVITLNQFSVNNQTVANDFQIVGINNLTGTITTNQFSVNTITCSGTDKVSAINNVTGTVTCSTDQSGSGAAREEFVAGWQLDITLTNIGTSPNTVYDTANSNNEGMRIDTNGMSTVTFQVMWTKVGSGTQKCQITDINGAGSQLIVITNLASGLNVNATQDIPAALENTIKTYRPECLSTTAGDDPVWLQGQVLLRP